MKSADNRSETVRETHPEDKSQIEEIIDERGGSQFVGAVMSHHDVVGKPDNNNAQLSQHDRDTQSDCFFIMLFVSRELYHVNSVEY